MKDRHKPRSGDRHSDAWKASHKRNRNSDAWKATHKGDLHSDEYKAKAKASYKPKPWLGEFQAFDGEGFNGKYILPACSALPDDVYNPNGLSTGECLTYLTNSRISSLDAIIGYGLSYDFEMILRDLPEEDFFILKAGEAVDYVENGQKFTLSRYIPRKMLTIHRHYEKLVKGEDGKFTAEPATKRVVLQDVIGFFQSSFEEALKKWKINIPEIITEGKALRNDFQNQPIEFIKAYNRTELKLLVELMNKLRQADLEAFETIGLKANHKNSIWYGPGSRAANFLNQTNFVQEHPDFQGEVADKLVTDVCQYVESLELEAKYLESDERELAKIAEIKKSLVEYPFSAAYYGGRIESSAVGTFNETLFDFDINSAYPFAIANLPKWQANDLVEVQGFDRQNRIGMYHVKWDIKEDCNFFPFPYRSESKNVFFPPQGEGWVMSPEVNAALHHYTSGIEVINGYVLEGTDGAGDGLTKLSDDKLCFTAKKIAEMAAARLIAKANGESKEKSLKLILNSTYGKTIQHVGSHKYLNLFTASWITSTCRAIILRAIGKDLDRNIIAIMTDGILSREKLDVSINKNLGGFDKDEFIQAIQLMPGVYKLTRADGTFVNKFRGMNKDFDIKKAVKILHKELKPKNGKHSEANGYFEVIVRPFVTRTLAVKQPNVFGDKIYQFFEHPRFESFSLDSKRAKSNKGFRLKGKEQFKFFEAKRIPFNFFGQHFISKPYFVGVEKAGEEYDEAGTLDEMFDDNHISSIYRDMEFEV